MEPTDSVIQHIVAVRISGERGPTAVWAPGRDLETEASLAATRLDELLKFGLVADVIVSTARIMPLTQELVQFLEADELRLTASVTMSIVSKHSRAIVD